jgi:hypothetical protein
MIKLQNLETLKYLGSIVTSKITETYIHEDIRGILLHVSKTQ